MSTPTNPRRDFLRIAGAAAGASLATATTAQAAKQPPAPTTFDAKSFGAVADGKTLDTPAINKAIEAASAAGGGTVRFSAGSYLCYSIHLKSNVELHLERGAKIVAADPPAEGTAGGYDEAEPNQWTKYQDFGHSHWHNSLIWGEGLENISITGPGLIWGKGLTKGYGPGPRAEAKGSGNKSIALKNCRNVLLRDFSVLHGGHFAILATGVDNFTIDNLTLDTNRDGMDIDCCRNVRVSNCSVNSPWDDGICLKSSYALGSAKPTEMVTITNCYVSGCWREGTLLDATYQQFGPNEQTFRTGRIKFGTESNGGFRNITISNCIFEGCQGLALETVDGALLEDVTVTNISMRDIISAPIFLRLGSRMRAPEGTPVGTLRRIIISNIVCSNSISKLGSIISGIPGHVIENVKISNIQIQHQGGGTTEQAALTPPENENMYPEPGMFAGNGRRPAGAAAGTPAPASGMPSHSFYVRHVKDIQFDNIEIITDKEDLRPAFVLDGVDGVSLSRIKVPHGPDRPIVALEKVTGFELQSSKPLPNADIEKSDKKITLRSPV